MSLLNCAALGIVTFIADDDVEPIGKIRRRRRPYGESTSAIARHLGLARNTVERALRLQGEAFEYRRRHQPRPKLGPYPATPEGWLAAEQKRPPRSRSSASPVSASLGGARQVEQPACGRLHETQLRQVSLLRRQHHVVPHDDRVGAAHWPSA